MRILYVYTALIHVMRWSRTIKDVQSLIQKSTEKWEICSSFSNKGYFVSFVIFDYIHCIYIIDTISKVLKGNARWGQRCRSNPEIVEIKKKLYILASQFKMLTIDI